MKDEDFLSCAPHKMGLTVVHGNGCGSIPLLTPPVTDIGDSGIRPRVCLSH